MTSQEAFWWGFFGSALPELIRLRNLLLSKRALPRLDVAYILIYIFISLAYMVGAGFFSVAWKPESPFKAIWVGVSFPVLVSGMLRAVPRLPR